MFPTISPFFFTFSVTFQMAKLKLFPSPVDECLQEHCGGQDHFLLQWSLPVQKFKNQLHGCCVNLSCTCCGNVLETSHRASRACQDHFPAICRLAPCLRDMLVSRHELVQMPQHDRCIWTTNFCKTNRSNGASFSHSTEASTSSRKVRPVETTSWIIIHRDVGRGSRSLNFWNLVFHFFSAAAWRVQSGRSSIAACTQWALWLLVPRAADHCRANLQTQRLCAANWPTITKISCCCYPATWSWWQAHETQKREGESRKQTSGSTRSGLYRIAIGTASLSRRLSLTIFQLAKIPTTQRAKSNQVGFRSRVPPRPAQVGFVSNV